ncbi:MAG: hypothetical protein ACTSRE_15795 [Promethearchaeota archaeon]
MINDEWDTVVNYITYYWNLFIAWFQALALPAQILVGVFLFFGVMAIAYTIYGALWITVQSIKFSILITVISVYLTFATLGLPLVAISGPKNIPSYWTKVGENVKWFVARMYPVKGGHSHKVETVTYTTQSQTPAVQNPPVVIIKESKSKAEPVVHKPVQHEVYEPEPVVEEVPQPVSSNPPAASNTNESFCPDCGEPFSDRMKYVLLDKSFTFCEECGQKIYRRD